MKNFKKSLVTVDSKNFITYEKFYNIFLTNSFGIVRIVISRPDCL